MHPDLNYYTNLYKHDVRTSGVNVEDFLDGTIKLSSHIVDSLELLQNFVQSNDPQLGLLGMLPEAHSILKNFLNLVQDKKKERLTQLLQYNFYPSSHAHIGEPSPKLRRPNPDVPPPTSPLSNSLPPMLPFRFAPPPSKPELQFLQASPYAPKTLTPLQPPPITMSNQITLPEGELIANMGNSGFDWSKISMKDFDLLGELGNGAFGTVRLCREIATGKLFCVKILDRNKIRYLKQREHIINERTIMFAVNHPFIVKLFCTFKSPSCLFFLMEFVAGGELFNYIRAEGQFTNETTKYVSAEIILALQYLHNQDIIYRDIKPENLLVDHQGHLKLTDFGFAKHIEDRTNSMCGTLDYMAPEILMAKGHGKGADWWSLGILIYEMLSGCPPLTVDTGNGGHAMNLIAAGKLEYPSYFDPDAVDLIKRLLSIDEKDRLGSRDDAEEIKRHPWFAGLQWSSIIQREHPGPLATLKAFKLYTGTPSYPNNRGNDYHGDINLREEMTKAGPSKTGSFDGFEGYRKWK
jgi:hypothetical protein